MTEELSQTQQIGGTQSVENPETPLRHSRQSLPPSSLIPSSGSFTCDTEIETQLLSDLVLGSSSTLTHAGGTDDSEMLGRCSLCLIEDILIILLQIWKLS